MAIHRFGDPESSRKVLAFHGSPGSGKEFALIEDFLFEHKLQLLAVDRPGYAQTQPSLPAEPLPNHQQQCQMLASLLDEEGIDKLILFGVSGGTPLALACAQHLGDRVEALILCGAMPILTTPQQHTLLPSATAELIRLAQSDKALFCQQLSSQLGDAEALYQGFAASVGKADQGLFAQEAFKALYQDSLTPSITHRFVGLGEDFRLLGQGWHFDLKGINAPISLWHGREDANVPLALAETLSEQLQDAKLNVIEGAGHYLWIEHIGRLLASRETQCAG